MKNGYLIAVDLDGTLVKNFDEYDKLSFELLKKLSKDNYIVIATGRPYRSSKYYYDLLELDTPIINYNGALIQNPNDNNFKKKVITIDRQIVIDLINDNQDILINIFCEIEDNIFLWKDNKEIAPYLHLSGGNLVTGSLDKVLKGDPNGAIVLIKLNSEVQFEKYIKDKYQDNLNVRFWNVDDNIQELVVAEIYSPVTSKGNALNFVAEYNYLLLFFWGGQNEHSDLETLILNR